MKPFRTRHPNEQGGGSMFVINWEWRLGVVCYLTNKKLRGRKPYTSEVEEAQKWKTRAAAERLLKRKDPSWAASCRIVEVAGQV
jgi:hypothetical protein